MNPNNARVNVTILDKDFQVACPESEQLALQKAGRELDHMMRQVRNSGTVVGTDRIAVMVALNLCHELQTLRNQSTESNDTQQRLENLNQALEQALQTYE